MFGKKKHVYISGDDFEVEITTDGDIIGAIGGGSLIINRQEDTRPFQFRDSSGDVQYRCDVCSDYHSVGHPHFA